MYTTTPADDADRIDYAGAVYGSLLAASVVAGASPRKDTAPVGTLIVLLLSTGIVFWLAHAYARLVGDRRHGTQLSWAEMVSAGRRERPLAAAAVPPAAAAALCWAIGLSDSTAAWAALLTALTAQVLWAIVADAKTNAAMPLRAVSVVINLLLGSIIVVLKVSVAH